MKTLRYYLKIYFRLASQYLKERMQFRVDCFCEIAGMVLVNVFGLLTFWVVFNSITSLGGFSFYEMLYLYGFSLMAMSPQQLLLDNAWMLFNKVVTGEFLKYCFRPVNILFYYMAETVDIKGFSQFALGVGMLIFAWIKLGIKMSFLNVITFLILWIGAALICMGLIVLSSVFGFMGGGTNAAIQLASDLKGYGRYPLTIFNRVLRVIFTFVIPIGFIAYYPASYFIGGKGIPPALIYLSPVIGFIFFYISGRIWVHYAQRYVGTGS